MEMKKTLWPPLIGMMFAMAIIGYSIPSMSSDLILKDTQEHAHRLSDYRGKWVLVNFWATWCLSCMSEIPDLVALNDAHKNQDMVVISVVMDYKSARQVTTYTTKHGITYPVVLGKSNTAEQLFVPPVNGYPTTYLIDKEGKVVGTQTGPVTRASIEEFVRCAARRC